MRPGRGGGGVSVNLMGGGAPARSLWRTPTPYVFLALAFMMGAIAVALLVLVCTRKKASSSSSSESRRREADDERAAARALVPVDREPKVVVFMPGDHAPSFLASAKPLGGGDALATAAACSVGWARREDKEARPPRVAN